MYDTIFVNNAEQTDLYKSLIDLHYNLTKYDNLELIHTLTLVIDLTSDEIITLNLNLK